MARRKKKQTDVLQAVKEFMDETGITDELKAHGADLIKGGIRIAAETLKAEMNPALNQPRPEYYFRPHVTQTAEPPPPPPPPVEDPNDPYAILGVRRDAHIDDIHAVFRARVKRLRPDIGGDAAEFQRIQEAWNKIQKARS